MTTNFSRPLQTSSDLDATGKNPPANTAPAAPARSKRGMFDCLKRRKTKRHASEDDPQPLPSPHPQRPSPHLAVRPLGEKSMIISEQDRKRQTAKEQSKAYNEQKRIRKAEERAQQPIIGGSAWGYSPTAGLCPSTSSQTEESFGGCFVSGRLAEPSTECEYEVDHLGRQTGRRWTILGTWGIEQGGPGREGKLGHGSLKGKGIDVSLLRNT